MVYIPDLEHGILVSGEALDKRVSLLQPAVHDEGDAYRQPPADLLVLCLLSISQHVLNSTGTLAN